MFRKPTLDSRGVTYLMVMFSIVLTGITLSAVGKHWNMIVQREKEADLLAKGVEIQTALALYSARMKAGRLVPMEVYPQSLAELTRLPRPYLRKVYSDPMSGGDWEYLRAPMGGIMGVRSKSKAKPIKEREFPLAVRHFEGRKTYHDWMFQHPNPSSLSLLASPMGGASPPMPSMQPPLSHMPFSDQVPPVLPQTPVDVPPMTSPSPDP
ncbi:MAG TPA: hypothetical protein VJ805_03555 [Nitrospiraceae bacterium]|nr:hypothetical protein [Nitrospiraceae bacterium]